MQSGIMEAILDKKRDMKMSEIFVRSEALMGEAGMKRASEARVIIFGVGGVGSWCAESLIRSGLKHLTIVDNDIIVASNVNRQLMATSKTIGKVKVDVLKERLLEINPDAEIQTRFEKYEAASAENFHLKDYDYVVDAIDSVECKAHLILNATQISKQTGMKFFSSMGAALRINPFSVTCAEFWDIKGDGLARALRNRFKKNKTFPAKKFKCVYSEETPLKTIDNEKGSVSYVTSIFGLSLAGLIMNDIRTQYKQD